MVLVNEVYFFGLEAILTLILSIFQRPQGSIVLPLEPANEVGRTSRIPFIFALW